MSALAAPNVAFLLRHPAHFIALGFGLGLAPKAPGTFGTLLAIPLAFVNPRGGRSLNLILALLVYVVYSNCMSMLQAWVTQGRIGVGAGLVGVHLVMLLVLATLFYRRLAVYPFWRWLR